MYNKPDKLCWDFRQRLVCFFLFLSLLSQWHFQTSNYLEMELPQFLLPCMKRSCLKERAENNLHTALCPCLQSTDRQVMVEAEEPTLCDMGSHQHWAIGAEEKLQQVADPITWITEDYRGEFNFVKRNLIFLCVMERILRGVQVRSQLRFEVK